MTRKHRGGQLGNQNARTHGFYTSAVPPEERHTLEKAAGIIGLEQEIALLRAKIVKALQNGEGSRTLFPGLSLLTRLLNTQKRIMNNALVQAAVSEALPNAPPKASAGTDSSTKNEYAPPAPI